MTASEQYEIVRSMPEDCELWESLPDNPPGYEKWKAQQGVWRLQLKGAASDVLHCMIEHANFHDGKCYPSQERMALLLAVPEKTVRNSVRKLKARGLMENTLVIFTTDNGYFHGEHGLADKWYPYEESIRVPLIVRDPRMPESRRGKINHDFVLNVDLAPTILSFAGVAIPTGVQGRDFAPLYLAANKPAWRQEFFYEHATIRNTDFIPSSEALVRKDLKYIYWPDFKYEELFDLKRDPLEEHNLAQNAAYSTTLKRLRARFAELKAKAK